jgi:hypothetical protein
MSLGVHFALTAAQLRALRAARDDDDEVLKLTAELEENWDRKWLAETDKAWDAIHRALSDGDLTFAGGLEHAPLGCVVLGGESMVEDEDETVVLIEAKAVAAASKALAKLTEADFRQRYFKLCKGYSPNFGEEDFAYSWTNLETLRVFFAKAAKAKRAIVFTVSS